MSWAFEDYDIEEEERLSFDGPLVNKIVKIDCMPGIAWHVDGYVRHGSNEGYISCHMIGDDRTFVFDPDSATLINDDEYCSCCGQMGCEAYR